MKKESSEKMDNQSFRDCLEMLEAPIFGKSESIELKREGDCLSKSIDSVALELSHPNTGPVSEKIIKVSSINIEDENSEVEQELKAEDDPS